MKKAILWIVFILLTAVSSLSANTLKADASAISLSVTNMILDKGYEDFLSIKKDGKFLDYEDYSDKTKWSTSDPSVATVSDDGTVMGKGYGTATITAAYEGKKYTCKVTVKQLKTLKSDSTTTVKLKGKVRKQTFPISGNGDMGNAYVLTVDTPFILSYDQGGLRDEMSLINEVQIYPEHGDTVIGKYVTVTGRLLSAQSSTYYCSYGLMDTNVISITSAGDLNEASKILDINGTVTLTVTGVNKGISWKSSDKSIAAVDAKGKVTGKKAGTATITASFNGKKKTCKITVINAAQYLKENGPFRKVK